jgi:hypothetical protein
MNRYISSGVIASLVIIIVVVCYAETKFVAKQLIPDEFRIKEDELTFEEANRAFSIIESSLSSFCALTEYIDAKTDFRGELIRLRQQKRTSKDIKYSIHMTLEDLQKIGNLGWAFQNIGFHNRIIIVKGTLLRQQAEIKRLEYELHKARQSDEKIIEKALKEARLSKKELDEFIGTHFWAD